MAVKLIMDTDVAARMKRRGWRVLPTGTPENLQWMKVDADGTIVDREGGPTWIKDLRAADIEIRDGTEIDWKGAIANCERAAEIASEGGHLDIAIAIQAEVVSMGAILDKIEAARAAGRVDLDRRVTCFADGIDWQHELGVASDGAVLYPSVEAVREHVGHEVSMCGVVEVEVRLIRWVEPQDLRRRRSSAEKETERPQTRSDRLLAGFESYQVPGWDGDEAEPVTVEALDRARELLDALPDWMPDPDVAPGADGSIGLDWSQILVDVYAGNIRVT